MKKFFFLISIFSLLSIENSFAQPTSRFKNSWINYNQQYLKIVINTKGIYRITKSSIETKFLQSIGTNPQKLQLFHRGEEIAINVDGESPSNYNFIEFYAINNDGLQDSAVYFPKTARLNENYSIYADSTSYFLTVGQNNGKRISNTSAVNTGIVADNYFLSKALINYNNEWNQDIATSVLPPATQSYFEPNEGLCSVLYFLYNNPPDLPDGTVTPPLPVRPFNSPLPIPNYNSAVGIPINYEALIISRNTLVKNINYTLGNSSPINNFFGLFGYNSYKLMENISTITGTSIPVNMQITTNPGVNDYFSLAYQKAKYARTLIYSDNLEIETKINPAGTSRINLTGANAGIIGYDFTDFKNQKKISSVFNSADNSIDLSINESTSSKNIWLSHVPKSPVFMRMANFTQITQSDYNYLIITDPRLSVGANAYKAYRESNALNGGRKFKVLLRYTQDLYDEFSYGERNPIAVRRFADYMTSTTAVMQYLFLIGKAYSQTSAIKGNSTAGSRALVDFAPTFGNPGSDNLLTGGLLGLPLTIPAIPTGRLSVGVNACGNTYLGGSIDCPTPGYALSIAEANQEVLNYLEKVNQHEHRSDSEWQKNILSVVGPKSGGTDGLGGEYFSLAKTMEDLRKIAVNSPFANSTNYLPKNKPFSSWDGSNYKEVAVQQSFYDSLNAGVGILNYFGHGTNVSTSHNVGYVSRANLNGPAAGGSAKYSNDGKYPLFIAMGCGISNAFSRDPCLTSDWIKTPGKGAINTIGQSTISYESYDVSFLTSLYNTWFTGPSPARKGTQAKTNATNGMLNEGIGDILKQSFINELAAKPGADPAAPNYDIIYGASFQQTILMGDPAIRLLRDPQTLPLSLTLLEVKALNEARIVKVNWKTENEVEFDKFEIERSIDSRKFEKIGEVNGKGINQEVSNYSFEDINPTLGLNYYRLKMIDLDGSSDYSKIVSANYEDIENQLVILENPFRNNQLNFKMFNLEEKSVKLYDIKGNNVAIELSKLSENKFKIVSKLNLQKGIYVFEAKNKSGIKYSSKIVSE